MAPVAALESRCPGGTGGDVGGESCGMHRIRVGHPVRGYAADVLLENVTRFAHNQPLLNVVNKREWY